VTRAASFAVLVALVAVFWALGRTAERALADSGVGVDDANIYFRYGRNLAAGLGCVWNPGGERVEGCTSPAWTAVCTLGFVVTPRPERLLFFASVACAAIAAWAAALGVARLAGARGALGFWASGLIVAAWVAASPGFAIWMTITLMDAALWTAALAVAWWTAVRWCEDPVRRGRQLALGGAAAGLVLTRPEGILAAPLLIAVAALAGGGGRGGLGARARAAAVPLLVLAAVTAALFVGRRMYFGWWLPNTWYAKVDDDLGYRLETGWRYLAGFARAHAVAASAAVLASVLAVLWRPRPGGVLAAALVGFGVVNVFFVGGDHFASWRILQPYWIFVPVLIAAAVAGLAPERRRLPGTASAVALASVAALLAGPQSWSRLSDEKAWFFFLAAHGRVIGAGFNEIFPPDERPVVGVTAAGGFPFAYEGRSFDLFGLNDVEMAHASRARRTALHGHGAFHAPTFFRRAPDFVIESVDTAPIDAPRPPEARIPLVTLDPEDVRRFDDLYVPAGVATPASAKFGVMLPVWVRRDWLARHGGRHPIREMVRKDGGWALR
jgi:hypothetical protein